MKYRTVSVCIHFALGVVVLCSLALGYINPASAVGPRCYVRADAIGGSGTSWGDAYKSLQDALGNPACMEIWAAKGTYKPTIGMDRMVSFVLKSGVAIYGGFTATETVLSQRNWVANVTILSGDIGVSGNSDNSYHVVKGSSTDSTAKLDGFTITGGNANGTDVNGSGGGIYNNTGSPTLSNLIFSDNSGIDGGGMYNSSSSPSLTNVTFINNLAIGGELYGGRGGGIYNSNSSPSLTNVTFKNNSASGYQPWGGGMFNIVSSPKLENATFNGNSAGDGHGGGMGSLGGSPILVNVTFRGNIAINGAGMRNNDTDASLTNVTFSNNTAVTGGGMNNTAGSSVTVKNSILYGDTGGEITGLGTTVTYSLVQGGYAGTGNLNVDPLLKPLGNYGGFTQTMALKPGSPAIDKGTNSGCPATDQRGVARPKGPRCDMGAYEFPQKTLNLSSRAAEDGWVRESGENTGIGGGSPDAASALLLAGDLSQKSQILSILSFDTAGLPDNAVITSVKVMVKKSGQVGPVDPFSILGNLLLDIKKGVFNDNPSLQVTDFQAAASKNVAVTIKNTPVSGWYTGTLGDANFQYINKTGMTQFRLRFTKDDNNDLAANELKLWSGNAVTAADRPKLIITYYIP